MSSNRKNDAEGAPAEGGAELQSAARRLAILKGLGKGAALAGAAVPLQTLAGSGGERMKLKKNTSNVYYHCSVSGNMSVMSSTSPSAVPQCGGQTPSHYACRSNSEVGQTNSACWPKWPSKTDSNGVLRAVCYGRNGVAYLPTANFRSVFGWGSSSTTIGSYVHDQSASDEAHWVTAALNATRFQNSFPYSPADVVNLSNSANDKAEALKLFKNWLNRQAIA